MNPVSAGFGGGVPTDLKADIAIRSEVEAALARARPAVVVNLAYDVGVKADADPLRSTEVNVLGFAQVLAASLKAGVGRVVYASSIAVYGDQEIFGDRDLVEEDHGWPTLLYGWQKQLNEATAEAYHRNFGLPSYGLRLSTIYGSDRGQGLSAPVMDMVAAALGSRSYASPVPPDFAASLIHVDDAASALATLALAPSPRFELYNSGGETLSMGEIANLIRVRVPKVDIRFDVKGVSRPHAWRVSGARFRDEFGLSARSFETWLAARLSHPGSRRRMGCTERPGGR
jgi:nucleoside-diphosphate-sugar epimerase